jgi:hypothetical protein
MKISFILATVVAIGAAMIVSTMAAHESDLDAHAATRGARAKALIDCARQAGARKFGIHFIQRRNFVRDCMRDHGFR